MAKICQMECTKVQPRALAIEFEKISVMFFIRFLNYTLGGFDTVGRNFIQITI
jgi:hypothetical protein